MNDYIVRLLIVDSIQGCICLWYNKRTQTESLSFPARIPAETEDVYIMPATHKLDEVFDVWPRVWMCKQMKERKMFR